jgi:membrane protein DedA with SNARE-associated domain
MSEKLQQLASWLVESHLAPWLFLLLVGLAFAEAALLVGFVLPGETALLLGGVLCAAGVFPLPAFLGAAVVAAALGDSTGYGIGHHFGSRIKDSRMGRKVGHRRWATAEAFVDDHGGKAVFLARGQAFLRAVVPALAGIVRMPYREFLPWNVAGAAIWGGGVVLLGYVFGHSLQRVEQALGLLGVVFAVVLTVLFVGWHRGREMRRRAAEERRLDPHVDDRLGDTDG